MEMKEITGYEGLYSITKDGRVWSHYSDGFIKTRLNDWGYKMARLYKNKKVKTLCIHKLLGTVFIDNPENKPQINHKNGIKTDNRIENLEWVTRSENVKHSYDIGLQGCNHGEYSGKAKLEESQVIEIKQMLRNNETLKSISKRFGVSIGAISHIKHERTWRRVK